jgi:hypothetical protein
MPFAALILAAALGAQAPMPSADAAVVVCELMVRAALRKPESFARTAEPIVAANTVAIVYSFRDARGRPATDTRTCSFHLAGDGRFHLEPFRHDHLKTRLEAAKAKLGKPGTPNDLMLVRSEILDIGREMFVQDDRMKKAERAAAKAGIYPIAQERTGLRAE